ncbi:1504_t:CDS:2, partial [Funneliformis caledonium]
MSTNLSINEKVDSIKQDLKQAEEDAFTLREMSEKDRLGNLGVIDDKYDVAISTACPASVLQNILVAQNLQQTNQIAFTSTRWR